MKKRRTKLLALALTLCLTVTSFTPAGAAASEPAAGAAVETSVIEGTADQNGGETSDISETPDVDETPDVTETPDVGETPDVTETPEPAETPDAEETPGAEETPAVTETPVPEETPDVSVINEENVGAADTLVEVKAADVTWESSTAAGKYRLKKNSAAAGAADEYYKNALVTIEDASAKKVTYALDAKGEMREGAYTDSSKDIRYFTTTGEAVRNAGVAASEALSPVNSDLGSMKVSTWVNPAGYWYKLNDKGVWDTTAVGKVQAGDDKTYYLDAAGKIKTNYAKNIDGSVYAFGPDGVMVEGNFYVHTNGKKYYFQKDGTRFEKAGWQRVDGSMYYFHKTGHYVVVSKSTTGWQQIKEGSKKYWYLFSDSGKMYKEQFYYVKSRNERYYFDKNGRMATGKNKVRGYYYYFRTESMASAGKPLGSAVTGWLKVGNYWHYFSNNGKAAAATSGSGVVKKIGGKYYYFVKDGRMYRGGGFRDYNGNRYYFIKQTDKTKPYAQTKKWLKQGSKWYYSQGNGRLAKGWVKIGSYYYYFNDSYLMQKNRAATRSGNKGWLDANGRFITDGWIKMNGNWKYIDSDDGFVTGWKYIKYNGRKMEFYFNGKGYLVQDLRDMLGELPASSYRIEVNRKQSFITVFSKASNGKFDRPVVAFACSVGNPYTLTPLSGGNGSADSWFYTATRSNRWQLLMGPSWGQYGTHVTNGIYFHSVSGTNRNQNSVPWSEYNKLGTYASHGCIRLCVRDARWIFYNCNGSKVRIYQDDVVGPFDKPKLPKMTSGQTKDPTDVWTNPL